MQRCRDAEMQRCRDAEMQRSRDTDFFSASQPRGGLMRTKKYLTLALCLLLASCGVRRAATTVTAGLISDGLTAVESESDLWIAKQSILPLAKVLEVLHAGDPGNERFSALMAKVYGNVAFGFFEPRHIEAGGEEKAVWKERMVRYYKAGSENGMRALKSRLGDGIGGTIMEFERSVKKAKKGDVPLMFWTAFDLGSFVNMKRDDIAAVADLPKVQSLLERVLELCPDFGYGSALAFKAVMLGSRPKMLGGDPEEAAKLFEKAISLSDGKYLMNKVLYAEWHAIPQGNATLAKKLLEEVASAGSTVLKGQELANALAIERARILLKRSKTSLVE
jgi:hypothetical protein